MSYSYTEKKRIRKNFGTFAKVMDLPNLIETQTKSYSEFLQADVAPEASASKPEPILESNLGNQCGNDLSGQD
jgi:DNA-directed RNA polymerase beta subunit